MNNKAYVILLFTAAGLLGCAGAALAAPGTGTLSGYAWGTNLGWINFGCSQCNTEVSDFKITGHAWSDNFGWINLSPNNGGVLNDAQGNLSGSAWGELTGWIDFSGVTISLTGVLSGSASADNGGNINFSCANCNVTTDYLPTMARGGAGGNTYVPPPASDSPFYNQALKVIINNSDQYTAHSLVTLYLYGSSQAATMQISNSSDFSGAVKEEYYTSKIWSLSPLDGLKTVYVKFFAKDGTASPVVSGSIILDTLPPEVKITYIKSQYHIDEEVMLGGTTEPNIPLIFVWDGQYGIAKADAYGNWFITLSTMPAGSHPIIIRAIDLAGNRKDNAATFLVKSTLAPSPAPIPMPAPIPTPTPTPVLPPLSSSTPVPSPIPTPPVTKTPVPLIKVPAKAPLALGGKWNLLPVKAQRN